MKVEAVFPRAGQVELEEIWKDLARAPRQLPFHPDAIAFCSSFSRHLFRDPVAKRYPELQALAFWMRESAVVTLGNAFAQQQPPGTVRTARGTVFHIPPSNVDTIFVYSWLLSLLCGNRNLLRLSQRQSPQTDCLLAAFEAVENETVSKSTWLVRYGHEDAITAAISAAVDVRVIWGGDATVQRIRQAPLAPHARELTFPDRYSFSVLHAGGYLQLSAEQQDQLALQSFNDIYWFDQMACSSPHLLIWVGEPEPAKQASAVYFEALAKHLASRGTVSEIGTRLSKFTFACQTILEGRCSGWKDSPHLTLLDASLSADLREHVGGGLLYQARVAGLNDILPFVRQKDQTVTHFGFSEAELRGWVEQLGDRGVDRVVPMGKALQFERFWDGTDLLTDLTRLVRVEA